VFDNGARTVEAAKEIRLEGAPQDRDEQHKHNRQEHHDQEQLQRFHPLRAESSGCRSFQVTAKTVRRWVERAQTAADLSARSCRPSQSGGGPARVARAHRAATPAEAAL